MATWAQFYDDVLPEVPGCGATLAEKEIRSTCIDFMYRTELQRKTVKDIDHPGGASALDLTTTAFVASTDQVIAVLAVWLNLEPLDPMSVEEIQEEYPDWDTITGTPKYYVQEGTNLWLVPSPAAVETNTIRVRVSYGPNETATAIPDSIFNAYREEIAAGAKGRLLAKAKKPWTDQSLAAEYMRVYSRAVEAAQVKVARGGRKVMLTVPTRGF